MFIFCLIVWCFLLFPMDIDLIIWEQVLLGQNIEYIDKL